MRALIVRGGAVPGNLELDMFQAGGTSTLPYEAQHLVWRETPVLFEY
jgi:hypothetical protein